MGIDRRKFLSYVPAALAASLFPTHVLGNSHYNVNLNIELTKYPDLYFDRDVNLQKINELKPTMLGILSAEGNYSFHDDFWLFMRVYIPISPFPVLKRVLTTRKESGQTFVDYHAYAKRKPRHLGELIIQGDTPLKLVPDSDGRALNLEFTELEDDTRYLFVSSWKDNSLDAALTMSMAGEDTKLAKITGSITPK